MRRAASGLLAIALALAGCKSTGSKPRPIDSEKDSKTAAIPAARSPDWLTDVGKLPGKGTDVPKAGTWAKPGDPSFNATREAQGVFAGRVFDPAGKGVKRAFIKIEPTEAPPPGSSAALSPRGIMTGDDGFFMTQGLTPGMAYILTAEIEQDGKTLMGVVQAQAPAPNLSIQLRDDMLPAPGLPPVGNRTPTTGALPPSVPGSPASSLGVPPPSSDLIPPTPTGIVPSGATTKPADGAFTPGFGATGTGIQPSFANPPGSKPGSTRPAAPMNPERIVNGPESRFPNAPIPASIPNGPPPLPRVPYSVPPPPPPPSRSDLEKKSAVPPRPGSNFALTDMMGRPWDFATSKHGKLVLVEFMTTTCVPCLQSLKGLKDLQASYSARGLQVVGVVCDDVSVNERVALASKYHREKNVNYMLFVEPDAGSLRQRFDVTGYPTAVLLNAAGEVLWKGHPSGDRAVLLSTIQANLGQ